MKKYIFPLILLSAGLVLTAAACGGSDVPVETAETAEATTAAPEETPSGTEETTTAPTEPETTTAEVTTTAAPAGPTELTEDQMDVFTEYFLKTENNGLLQSSYDIPQELDLDQALYNGGGMSHEITEEELAAYREIQPYDDGLDMAALTGSQISDYLQRKAGYGINEFAGIFNWIYLDEFDLYVNEHGDSNMKSFTCKSGTDNGDGTFSLHMVGTAYDTGEETGFVSDIKVRDAGEGNYQVVSCSYTTPWS